MKLNSFIIVFFIVILVGCSTFKGDIPIEQSEVTEYYISPLNGDGVNDIFSENINIPEIKGLKIVGYNFYIESIFGDKVLEVSNGVKPTSSKLPKIKKPKTITIPDEITWDGRDSNGNMTPDGRYLLSLEVWGLSGNVGKITPIVVIVDNTAPTAIISVPFTTFSPNSTNGLNVLSVTQDSSQEELWVGTLYNKDNTVVSTYKWVGITDTLDLDGFDINGNKIPDSDYMYELKSTDRAGNSFSTKIEKITIDRRESKIFFKNGNYYLSPNNDGIKDSVKLILDTNSPSPDISSGVLQILDSLGRVVRNYKPLSYKTPIEFTFDGFDDNNRALEEGIYYARFNGELSNKTKVSATSNKIFIDITTPASVLSTQYEIFSPDGDGNKDTISINQSTSVEGNWIGEIVNSKNVVVLRKEWEERAVSFLWDGLDDSKKDVPDGIYYYNLYSEDSAGNNNRFRVGPIKVDRTETLATLAVNKSSFSPNNDGIDDYIEFLLGVSVPDGIESWNLVVKDSTGVEVYRKNGDSVLPKVVPWTADNNKKDGIYSGELEVVYVKGNIAKAVTKTPFSIDLTPPEVKITIEPKLFSPDGDGVNDKLFIKVSATDQSNKFTIVGEIQDPYGNKFKSLKKDDFKNNQFIWDGKSDSGELVQSATDYKLILKATDSVGNIAEATTELPIDILVIKDGNKLRIIISSIYFKPYTADYINIDPELLEKNLQTINRLSEVLKKYPEYKINLEGNAVRVFWNDPKKWLTEEKDILLPLSEERAEVIREALIGKGVKPERMYTQGLGGYYPVVPHSDLVNRWKNRRVEFILIK